MRFFLAALTVFSLSQAADAALQVQVSPSAPSPQPVGSEVVFTFSAKDTNFNPGILNFRFEAATPQNPQFTVIRDFESATTFKWARNLIEGLYQIRVTARDSNYLKQPSQLVIPYRITSRITDGKPVVSATTHPLVALFSAPACVAGKSLRIVFQSVGSQSPPFYTNYVPCNGKTSMNLLIGGMAASTVYSMFSQVGLPGGILQNGTPVTWTTDAIPPSLLTVPITFPVPFGPSASQTERLSLLGFNTYAVTSVVNSIGKMFWYYAGDGASSTGGAATAQVDRLLMGGHFLTNCGYLGDYTGTGVYGNLQTGGQALQIIDLTGHVVQETNVDRVNEQLLAMGTDPISTFNHDARLLPNGHVITIAVIQRVFPAGTQGSQTPIDILGTVLVELDQNFQVVWYWNAFDHDSGNGQLDINRPAILKEKCTVAIEGINGCPSVLLTSPANDWLHTNTLQYQPADGSLIISIRNQDWVAKIDYENGHGTGNILWIMGNGGTFALNNLTGDPWPWFSHQHDVEFQNNSTQLMTLFDNGNTRVTNNGGNSRGYVLKVDESGLQVTPQLLADLGYYAVAQGSAQVLSNGDYQFLGGQIVGTAPNFAPEQAPSVTFYEEGVEVTPSGVITYSESAQSEAYRMWRLSDLFNLPSN